MARDASRRQSQAADGCSVSALGACLQVRNAFDFAYQQLSAPAAAGEAILQRIIRWAAQHPQKTFLLL